VRVVNQLSRKSELKNETIKNRIPFKGCGFFVSKFLSSDYLVQLP